MKARWIAERDRMRWILITFVVFAVSSAVLLGRPALSGDVVPWWAVALAFGIGLAFGARRLLARSRD